jgi:hypothetical protein
MKNLHDRWKIEKEVKQWIKSWKFRLHNEWKVEKLPFQNAGESSNLCYDCLGGSIFYRLKTVFVKENENVWISLCRNHQI